MKKNTHDDSNNNLSRRDVLKWGAAGCSSLLADSALAGTGSPSSGQDRPNILLILTDQQGLDTLSAYDNPHVSTPAMDRLARTGTSFMESHSSNPVCSPARSSILTGRMTSETGVVKNGIRIRKEFPNLGQWLQPRGYETVYAGKWHLKAPYTTDIPGFRALPVGMSGHGTLGDETVSRACEGFLHNRESDDPFLLVASFLQPHDICQWINMQSSLKDDVPYPDIEEELPPVPDNFEFDKLEPAGMKGHRNYHKVAGTWSKRMWRYYHWSYYRMVEEVDAEVDRLLRALERSGHAQDTLVVFTSDHGEGRGRHQTVTKNFLYDEAVKVPLIFSWPDRIPENRLDRSHIVSGIDIVPTICEYAGVESPPVTGRSLRSVMEGDSADWRNFAVSEVKSNTGRALRTPRYKYIGFREDPVEQLFDMKKDPGETKNLARDPGHRSVLKELKKQLYRWEDGLDLAEGVTKWRHG